MGKLFKNKKLLIIVLVVLLGGAFAAKTFLLKPPPIDEKKLAKEEGPTYVIADPFVVNLADRGETSHFAKVSIALGVSKLSASHVPAGAHGSAEPVKIEAEPKIRDIINGVLSAQTSDELLSEKGRDRVKHEIVALVNKKTELKIVEVFYTEFAVQ